MDQQHDDIIKKIRRVFSTPEGQDVLRYFIETYVMKSDVEYATNNNPLAMAYSAGQRSIVIGIRHIVEKEHVYEREPRTESSTES